jgi:hypothetical protein
MDFGGKPLVIEYANGTKEEIHLGWALVQQQGLSLKQRLEELEESFNIASNQGNFSTAEKYSSDAEVLLGKWLERLQQMAALGFEDNLPRVSRYGVMFLHGKETIVGLGIGTLEKKGRKANAFHFLEDETARTEVLNSIPEFLRSFLIAEIQKTQQESFSDDINPKMIPPPISHPEILFDVMEFLNRLYLRSATRDLAEIFSKGESSFLDHERIRAWAELYALSIPVPDSSAQAIIENFSFLRTSVVLHPSLVGEKTFDHQVLEAFLWSLQKRLWEKDKEGGIDTFL